MHSGLSFCALLAGILFILFMQDVEALPVIRNKRASKTVTLPLKRLETSSRNVHPQVLLQQHLNRSNRRLARMTGNEAPTDQALRRNIQKRVLSLEQEQVYKRFNRYTPPVPNTKRFNRGGVTPHNNVVVPASLRKGHRKHGNNNNDDQAATAAGNGTTTSTKGKGGVAAGGAAAGTASGSAGNDNSNSTTTANGSDTVTAAEEPAADNSIGLDIESVDVGYLATIQMGTPPQDFSLLMDSGSADTWVGGENCVSEDGGDCGAHTFLGAQSSSSFVDSGNAFQVTYGTGAVEGTIVQDNIVVAGLNLDAHNFGVATTESVEFSSDQTSFDGLVGLAQSSLSEQGVPTPPEALAAAGLIDGAITSYKISRLADGLNDGEITFGGLDETKFDAKTLVTLDNVNANGFWEADVDSATVDGVDLGLAGRTAILDTGTTLMIVPAEDALTIHQQIDGAATDGQGGFTVPCTTTQSIALTFGGQEFTIDPRDLAFQPLDPANPEGDCISGIGAGNIGAATQWLVGDTFLKNAYFSHSVDDNTISLAKLV